MKSEKWSILGRHRGFFAVLTLFLIFHSSLFICAAQPQVGAPRAERVVISKEAMTLTVYGAGDSLLACWPIAAGVNLGNKQRAGDHKTPEGDFTVQQIQNASHWTHDFRDGKGEIKGAYGSHFIRLLTPPHKGIGIHGTHDPSSIGTRATEGCIRLRNADLLEFVKFAYVGLPVTVLTSRKDRAADGR